MGLDVDISFLLVCYLRVRIQVVRSNGTRVPATASRSCFFAVAQVGGCQLYKQGSLMS